MTKLLTADELGKMLRIPKRSIYKFAKKGLLPGTIRIGRHWRFNETVVNDWMSKKLRTKERGQVRT